MDKELIKKACSPAGAATLNKKLQASMPSSVRAHLEATTPSNFLRQHNKDVGVALVNQGYTPGALMCRSDLPTLEHVGAVYGDAAAVAWLMVQIDSIDVLQGNATFSDTQRRDTAQLIFVKYKKLPVCCLLIFFTQYKLGEFTEEIKHVGGIEKLLVALRLFSIRANDEMNKIFYYSELERERKVRYGENT